MLAIESLSVGQYGFIGNAFSFGLAVMASTTLFLWLMKSQVAPAYQMAITISGLVTAIAAYHYLQIMLSWDNAATVNTGQVLVTGEGFNRAYRYVDWLLTVPLLLIELILVMKLSNSETFSRSVKLGGAAALMIVLGYPGEVAETVGTRAIFWILSQRVHLQAARRGKGTDQKSSLSCHCFLGLLSGCLSVTSARYNRRRCYRCSRNGLHHC